MRPTVPPVLRETVQGYRWRKITIGESGADTYRLTALRRQPLILKFVRGCPHNDLQDEARRVTWFGRWAPAPEVLATATEGDSQWLVMTALPGVDALQSAMPPRAKVELIAKALSALHAKRVRAGPFDESRDRKIARATENVVNGLVDESQFDERNAGRSATSLLRTLLATRPSEEDRMVTHGDACLPNFMLHGEAFAGFVDCSRAGLADRYQDLALACRSIEYDLGEEWVAPFLHAYGLPQVDRQRLAFYRLLDEFF
jgi:aminoglycoside 3'-phosphotransferase II